jgi:hypothetical protein
MQNIAKEKVIELPAYFYFAGNNKHSKLTQNHQLSELVIYSGDVVYISKLRKCLRGQLIICTKVAFSHRQRSSENLE